MMNIAGIYLAAGKSRRMGRQKIALPVGSTRLGSIALRTILTSKLKKVYIVVAADDPVYWLKENLHAHPKSTLLHCKNAQLGMSQSIHCGVRQAIRDSIDAVIIFLADQPMITVEIINMMISTIHITPQYRFIATSFQDTIYPPVLFTKEMYPALLRIDGDAGAKSLLVGEVMQSGTLLSYHDERIVFDVDTMDDFQHFSTLWKGN